jgi:predicted nucleic acid-binding Zn ribbon protein
MPANVVADFVAGDLAPPDLPDTAVIPSPDAANLQLRVETKPRKQIGQTSRPKLAETTQVPPARSIPSNKTLSLDDEIRVLRGQLAKKLRLQNAQLRKMLERFER